METMDRKTEPTPLNRDILSGQWKQLRGALKSWWGLLTDDDVDRIAGQKDRLIGTLQEKYGYTRDMAQRELDRHLKDYDETHTSAQSHYAETTAKDNSSLTGNVGQTVQDAAQGIGQRVSQTASDVKAKTEELGSTLTEKTHSAATSVGESMSSLAGTIRQKAPTEGAMGTAAAAVADRLDTAGSYLQDSSLENMTRDVTDLIRRYPLQSFLIGIGLGYLVARNSER
jgi:uncharacterized protein YjbJ (UPF0337 family)